MRITFYGLKTCDTCKKALKALQSAEHDVTYVDVRADGISANDLARFQAVFAADLVNTRSATWRGLSEADRVRPALALIAEYPTLMKRPVIDVNNQLFLGWTAKTQSYFGL